MITEWLVDTALGLVEGLTGLLPPLELDLSGLAGAFDLMSSFNEAVPVTETLAVVGLLLTVYAVLFVWRVVKTLLAHVPFVGGGG